MGDFAAEHKDIKQFAMVVPNAVEILSDKLPAFAPAADQGKYLDALGKDLEGQGDYIFGHARCPGKEQREKTVLQDRSPTGPTEAAYLAFLEAGRRWAIKGQRLKFEALPVTGEFQGTLSAKSGFRYQGKG